MQDCRNVNVKVTKQRNKSEKFEKEKKKDAALLLQFGYTCAHWSFRRSGKRLVDCNLQFESDIPTSYTLNLN